jgi:hypothetical protein
MTKSTKGSDTLGGTPVDPTDGLLDARNPVKRATRLEDPRAPTWTDQIAAERRRLQAAYSTKGRKVVTTSESLSGQMYKYSRGVDLTNDEMGYGERGKEILWSVSGKELRPEERTIQRTKSGRQVLTRP